MGRKIVDRDVSDAIKALNEASEILENEALRYEEIIEGLEEDLKKAEVQNEDHEQTIEELNQKIKDLEEALAEAYLTSEP